MSFDLRLNPFYSSGVQIDLTRTLLRVKQEGKTIDLKIHGRMEFYIVQIATVFSGRHMGGPFQQQTRYVSNRKGLL